MIKALRIDREFASPRHFESLRAFLETLGFQNEVGEEEKDNKSATLSAPLGKISFGCERRSEGEKAAATWDFAIEVDDPDSAARIIREKQYTIVSDFSEYQTGWRHFIVRVTPELRVAILGAPDHWAGMHRSGCLHAESKHFAVVLSRFNSFITERLLAGASDALFRLGADPNDIHIVRVPGSFEIPSAARTLAETKKYDAIICLGCLLRGDTAHYDAIVNEVTRGIGQSAQETGIPHAFGVLTCDTLEQAIDRAGLKMGNKGFEAALSAVEMANLKAVISHQPSATKGNGSKLRAPGVRKTKTRTSNAKRASAPKKRKS
jgi:6,7-dimethyl-8-ribityllumazine synthase